MNGGEMAARMVLGGWILALLGLVGAGCSQFLPGYEDEIQQREAAISAVEGQRDRLAEEVAALSAEVEGAPEEVRGELEATLGALRERRAELKGQAAAMEEALVEFRVDSAGRTVGAGTQALLALLTVLGGTGTVLGARAASLAGKLKAGPSRAKAEVDELWDELSAQKARLERALTLAEVGTQQVPPTGTATMEIPNPTVGPVVSG